MSLISSVIEAQNCLVCGKESGTKIVCDECRKSLTRPQEMRMDKIYQRTAIELGGNVCVDCSKSAETESGELAADHLQTKGARPDLRYCLANCAIRCLECHNKRHAGNIPVIPKSAKKTVKKFTKPPTCKVKGCPIYALKNGFCCKHQK